MRNLLLFLSAIFILSACQSSEESAETNGEKNIDEFAELSENDSFKYAHRLPGDFKLTDGDGEMIKYPVTGGTAANAYYIEGAEDDTRYFFVFHEWYGLNDYVKKEAEKLHKIFPEANILALDLYDGKVATNRDEASQYMQNVDNDRAVSIIMGASEFAGEDARIGTVGWCFGGGWSLQAALKLGEKADACVMYYGMPVMDTATLKKIEAPVLGHFAKQDDWITPEKVTQFKDAMESIGKSVEIHRYDAAHAFANPSRDIYKPKAAEDAWKETVAFFREHMDN